MNAGRPQRIRVSVKLFLDTADEAAVEGLWGLGAFAGITTNPVLLARAGVTVEQVIARCRALDVERIFVQATGDDREAIVRDAMRLADMWRRSARPARKPGRNRTRPAKLATGYRGFRRAAPDEDETGIWIKIPAFDEGYAAMARLQAEGIPTAATAVVSLGQALMAVEAGTDVVIPFLGRAEACGISPAQLVDDVAWVANSGARLVLVASVKTEEHVRLALRAGCWAVTLPPDLAQSLASNDAAKKVIDAFRETKVNEDE